VSQRVRPRILLAAAGAIVAETSELVDSVLAGPVPKMDVVLRSAESYVCSKIWSCWNRHFELILYHSRREFSCLLG